MDLAYAAADVVISRSGALAVSELCIANKPCILVPSPNVAEDHQTKNAMALVNKEAAFMITDKESKDNLVDAALQLLFDEQRCNKLSANIAELARPNATQDIVDEIERLIGFRATSGIGSSAVKGASSNGSQVQFKSVQHKLMTS